VDTEPDRSAVKAADKTDGKPIERSGGTTADGLMEQQLMAQRVHQLTNQLIQKLKTQMVHQLTDNMLQ
jgi:hypothetical protein